jgi:hypothetical protein
MFVIVGAVALMVEVMLWATPAPSRYHVLKV